MARPKGLTDEELRALAWRVQVDRRATKLSRERYAGLLGTTRATIENAESGRKIGGPFAASFLAHIKETLADVVKAHAEASATAETYVERDDAAPFVVAERLQFYKTGGVDEETLKLARMRVGHARGAVATAADVDAAVEAALRDQKRARAIVMRVTETDPAFGETGSDERAKPTRKR